MNVYIVYNDPYLFGSLEPILTLIENKYKCKRIEFNKLYKKEVLNQSSLGDRMGSFFEEKRPVPDILCHELMSKELSKVDQNVLIRNYPRTKEQANLLLGYSKDNNFQIQKIWYFEAINTIQNLLKVEKYKIQAMKNDPSLSKIKKRVIESKKTNLNCLEFIDQLNITEIIGLESHGNESQEKIKSICEYLLIR